MSIVSTLFNQTIDIYSVSFNAYGDKTRTIRYSDVPCRFQEKVRTVLSVDKEEVITSVDVWVDSTFSAISEQDQVVSDSESYEIVKKETKRDIYGNVDHYRLYLV